MKWDEQLKDRFYAALHHKIGRIEDEFRTLKAADRFCLTREKYCDFLESIGIQMIRWKKSRKIPPHWVAPPQEGKPVSTENCLVIPDPFFNCDGEPKIINNYEKNLALLVPNDTAEKILVLGLPPDPT